MPNLQFFAPIQKVDEAQRLVYGIAALETPDKVGEIFDYETSKPNFVAWSTELSKATGGRNLGNVRAMHGTVAAGHLVEIEFDDAGKQIPICAKITDDNEWRKVVDGTYTGFSIGGRYVRKWADHVNPSFRRYTARPNEVTLADNPCIPGAYFTMVKADGAEERVEAHGSAKAMREEDPRDATYQVWRCAKVDHDHYEKADALECLQKGDSEGHPFRGNQYTGGGAGTGSSRTLSRKEEKHIDTHSPNFTIHTGLQSHEGATHLAVYHHNGNTLVSPMGEAYNGDNWAHSGIHSAEDVRDAYVSMMKDETTKTDRGDLQKGDVDGHEFHGNQWTGGRDAGNGVTFHGDGKWSDATHQYDHTAFENATYFDSSHGVPDHILDGLHQATDFTHTDVGKGTVNVARSLKSAKASGEKYIAANPKYAKELTRMLTAAFREKTKKSDTPGDGDDQLVKNAGDGGKGEEEMTNEEKQELSKTVSNDLQKTLSSGFEDLKKTFSDDLQKTFNSHKEETDKKFAEMESSISDLADVVSKVLALPADEEQAPVLKTVPKGDDIGSENGDKVTKTDNPRDLIKQSLRQPFAFSR